MARDVAKNSFELRMDIILFIGHSGRNIRVSEVIDCVATMSNEMARNYLNDLVGMGYLFKPTIYTYAATEKTKQLFGIKNEKD